MGFLSDQRRLNVALTRARSNMIVLGHATHLSHDPVWRRLITEAREHQCCVEVTPHTFKNGLVAPVPRSSPTQAQPAPPRQSTRPAVTASAPAPASQPRAKQSVTPSPSTEPWRKRPRVETAARTPHAPPKVVPAASLLKPQAGAPRTAPPKVVPSASLLQRTAAPRPRPSTTPSAQAPTPPAVGRAHPTWLRSARPPTLPKKP